MTSTPPDARKRRYQIEWLFLWVAVLTMGGTVSFLRYQSYLRIDTEQRERLSSQAAVIERNLIPQLASIRQTTQGIIEEIASLKQGKSNHAVVNRRLKYFSAALVGVRTILVIDAQGQPILSNRTELLTRNFANRDYFQIARKQANPETLYVSPPFKTARGLVVINLTRALLDERGQFAGVITVSLDPNHFSTLLDSVRYSPDTQSSLIHGDGTLFMIEPNKEELIGTNLAVPGTFFFRHQETGRSSNLLTGIAKNSGVELMLAARTINPPELSMDKPLVVAVSRHLESIFAVWREEAQQTAAISGLVTLLAILSLLIHQRRQKINDSRMDSRREERRATALALEASEASFRTLFEQAAVGVALIDTPSGKFLRINEKYCAIVGYSPTQMRQLDLQSISHPDDLQSNLAHLEDLKAGRRREFEMEKRLIHADGRSIWVKLTVSPLWAIGAPPLKHIAVVQEITAQKNMEADMIAARRAAEAANQTKSKFMAAASHDLRQPLQAINLFHDALIRTGLNEEQQRLSDNLSLSTRSLDEALTALLSVAKLDQEAFIPKRSVVNAQALLSRINDEFSLLSAQRQLRLKLYFPPRDIELIADVDLLLGLLRNLIGNALKYTQRGGVLISIRRRAAVALIQVWDTGIGIAPEYHDRIFDAYFQIDNPTQDLAQGLGLGLAIVKHAAQLMETEVKCRSRRGRGTVFAFTLPLAVAAE